MSFTDASVAPAGVTLTGTTWNFGDGTPIEQHPPGSTFTHTFPSWGPYTVTMFNTSAAGCRSTTLTKQILISPTPVPDFSFVETSVCMPLASVSFVEQSTIPDGTTNALTYAWILEIRLAAFKYLFSQKSAATYFYRRGTVTVTLTKECSGCLASVSK